ncbi:MAG TPA: peptide deformylase [Moorella mulderi]|nr:peptide deformylase [Moorella mulderi]
MAKRNIVLFPSPLLREKCQPVKNIGPKILKLLEDMAETMYAAPGVGLAAPQVGILKRVAVVDIGEGLIELINPEIVEAKGQEIDREGCLSLPGIWGEVPRYSWVKVRFSDRGGRERILEAEGFLARALQHEIDHLDGVLFIDRALKLFRVEEGGRTRGAK